MCVCLPVCLSVCLSMCLSVQFASPPQGGSTAEARPHKIYNYPSVAPPKVEKKDTKDSQIELPHMDPDVLREFLSPFKFQLRL